MMSRDKALARIEDIRSTRRTVLNLSELGLEQLPDEVAELSWLTAVFASFNAIADITILSTLPNLERIDLRGNRILELQALSSLVRLEYLDAAGNGISDLTTLRSLSGLKILYLDDNQITDISALSSFSKLRRLYLSNNRLTQIGAVAMMGELAELDISRNQISDLLPLSNSSSLTRLDITSNVIVDLEPLCFQKKLRVFFFGHNLVRDLTPIAPHIERGLVIRAKDRPSPALNPLTTPPPEIVSRGNASISNYFSEIEKQGSDSIYEAKLLIIGEGGVGKTSLARKIENSGNSLPAESESTMGIEVRRLPFMEVAPGKLFYLNVWDFGGQEIYHATHQFFLTHRSVYVLVDDTRKDAKSVDDEMFSYWLQIVELLGGNSPLLIVQNEKSDRSKQIDLQSMQARFSFIKDSLPVNLATNRGLEHVLRAIEYWLLRLEHVGERLPIQWITIRRDISLLAQSTAHISFKHYLEICSGHKIRDERALSLSEYLHDLGAFLHYQDDFVLQDIVILQNNWATDAVYAILNDETIKGKSGYFSQDDLGRLWAGDAYRHHHHILMALMEKFELCYKLVDCHEPTWLAPQLLPITVSEFEWTAEDDLIVRYEYDFLPKGILPRVIVRLNRYVSDLSAAWRSGVVLTRQSTRAFIAETYARKEIVLRVSGESPRDLMTIVTEEIDRINETYELLEVHKMIPCSCYACKNHDTPHFYRYNHLQARLHRNKTTVECERSYDAIDVRSLLEGVFSRTVGKRYEDMSVFISYSHKDKEYVDRLQAHLAALKLTHHLVVWSDSDIPVGSDWDEVVHENVRTANIVLLLISADFLSSRYIWEKELPVALERNKRGDAIVIPIFVRPCDCDDLAFMKLQGLPRRAVSSYRNRDLAYTEIVKGIRKLLATVRF